MAHMDGRSLRKSMRDLFIDTNVFLRFFHDDGSKQHQESTAFFQSIFRNSIAMYTSTIVMSEIYFILHKYYQLPKKDIISILLHLLKLKNLTIVDQYDYFFAIGTFAKNNIKFIDCLIGSMKELSTGKMILVSYDAEFDRINIKRKTPAALLIENAKEKKKKTNEVN